MVWFLVFFSHHLYQYYLSTMNCDLCNSSNKEHAYSITATDPAFEVSRCRTCGHLYMDPPFSGKELEKMYTEDYFTGKAAFSYTDERENIPGFRAVADARIRRIRRLAGWKNGTGRRFLDIGCSFGSLLDAAKRAGFTTFGMDISEAAAAEASVKGHTVLQGSPEMTALPGSPLDAVTMVEVIEHLVSPSTALAKISEAIRPGGLLLIQTANMNGRQAVKAGADYHYFLPGHLHYFSRQTLTELLKKNNFGQIRCHYPCEFGLLPKLRKSAGTFTRLRDYLAWLRISRYHLMSKIHFGSFAMTSGMVITAIRK